MPIRLRLRGDVWHARGTVRVGAQTVVVRAFSTGARQKGAAEAVAAAHEADIRQSVLDGPAGRARTLTVADCFESYLSRPGGVKRYDQDRIADFNDRIGGRALLDAKDAWKTWLETRGRGMAPGTAQRWRSILLAALNHGAAAHGAAVPKLPGVRQKREDRVVYLTQAETARMLAAYNPAARLVAVTLAYQGMRTQEALRLDWRDVSWPRRSLRIVTSKTGKGRSVPMHRRVRVALYLSWRARGRPVSGPVFLSSRGAAYADTRGKGGNPLAQAHATACAAAGVTGFRVHDWRHHWAAHMVMAGADLFTICRLGGWSSMRMVERYASVSMEHMEQAVARLR